MESNVYQAPASEILTAKPEAAGVALYVVAPWKFNLLFWATMGIYGLYWNFKNKLASGLLIPMGRTCLL